MVTAACAIVLLSGCSSGGSTTSPAASDVSKTPVAPAPAAKPAAAGPSDSLSSPPITEPRPFPQLNAATAPPAVLGALKNKRAIFLIFYDPAQSVTADQKKVVAALSAKFKGLIEFITYSLPKTNLDGTVAEKKTAAQVADLAQRLDVGYMPTLVVVTRDGLITWQSTGYQDFGPLEREILRATR
jgi:hypothetical protein